MTIRTRIRKVASRLGLRTTLYCSFCGKSQHEVAKLVAGPSVFICDECVAICTGVIQDSDPPGTAPKETPTASPDNAPAAASKDAPAAESHRIEDIQSMPTERLLRW